MTRVSVVTGGAGFIGSHLVDALLARGDQVVCVDNLVATGGSTRNVDHVHGNPSFTLVVDDILNWATADALNGVDSVFHLAASKKTVSLDDPERDLQVNAMGTLRILLAAVAGGVSKVVHASTGSVLGEATSYPNNQPPSPRSVYGVSKLAAEAYCRVMWGIYGLNVTVLRYYHVIGPRQDDSERGGVVPIFVRRCQEGRPVIIYGSGEQLRSFTSVADLVAANLLVEALPGTAGEVYNCASGVSVTIQELAEYVIEATGVNVPIEYEEWRPGDIVHFDIDNSAIRDLGLHFDTDWRRAVRDIIAWRRSLTADRSP